ncbi:hypothetical protein MY3957_009496 [Beauveria namnaoensis]
MPGQACIPLSTGIPPICIASLQDNHGELNRLIQQGSDIEAPNPNTNATAQHLASSLSHGKLVRLLLQPGANYSAVDDLNETPLHNAAISGNFEAAQLFAESRIQHRFGANVSAVDDDGETRLHVAASHGSGPETLQILLRAGADINALSRDGQTPLLKADGYTESVEYLLKEGADARIASPDGITCLHKAAGSVPEHVQLILDL